VIRLRRVVSVAAGAALLIAGLGGCAGTVSLEAAEAANDPVCAAVSVRLPPTVGGEQRRWTDAQATGAWGSPATVLLTCGVDVPGPSTLRCESVEGVDWLVDESRGEDDLYTFTTFGRDPAVEVFIDFNVVSSADVLRALSPMLRQELPINGRECTAPADTPGS
jgi:hypothetical protein